MAKLCECGCGAEVQRRFLLGHSKRIEYAGRRILKGCACGCGLETYATYLRGHSGRLRARDKQGNKRCPLCGEWKPYTAEFFPRSGKRGLGAQCKPCHVKRGMANEIKRRAANPEYLERRRAQWRKHRAKTYAQEGQKLKDTQWRSNQRLRAEMITAYGGACSCCGEKEVQFLTLEHTANDGKLHRAQVGEGYNTYRDLRRRGWPKDGFTTLCWNCHMATRTGRICPHKSSAVTTDLT